ncbi:hypothetical protein V6N11_036387 [Hibiscus sabdariffa]|uniref:Uncharacterized protein n=1 Tax=Hibiscus sabdariffa TaxID=183260 RepID=A0ABR2RAS4_9ROSI
MNDRSPPFSASGRNGRYKITPRRTNRKKAPPPPPFITPTSSASDTEFDNYLNSLDEILVQTQPSSEDKEEPEVGS